MSDTLEIFGVEIGDEMQMVIFVAVLFAFGAVVHYGTALLRRLFRLWLAHREVVLTGGEMDDGKREQLTAAFDLLTDEKIYGYRGRAFLFAPKEHLIITDKRICLQHAKGSISIPVPDIADRSFPGIRSGRFVVGPFEFSLSGRNDGSPYGLMIIQVMGGPDASKLTGILNYAIIQHGKDTPDDAIPRQGVSFGPKQSGSPVPWFVAGVPLFVGLALLALAGNLVYEAIQLQAASGTLWEHYLAPLIIGSLGLICSGIGIVFAHLIRSGA